MNEAAIKIQQFLASNLHKSRARKGIYTSFVSLEGHNLSRNQKVQVFGEFTRTEGAWAKKVFCPFVESLGVFGTYLTIQIGDSFKFIVDDGKQYVVSKKYLFKKDHNGIYNNVFRFHTRTIP